MAMTAQRRLESLPRAESLRLLSTVSLGRLVFTHLALPAIRPVNHAVAGDQIIIRAYLGTAISAAVGDRPARSWPTKPTSSTRTRTWAGA